MKRTFAKRCAAALSAAMLLASSTAMAAHLDHFSFDYDQGGAMGIQRINLVDDPEAGIMVLWPDETVTDVTVEKVIYDNGTLKGEVMFTAASLESNQVICLQGFLPDVIPGYRVNYTDPEGNSRRLYMTDSGEDGSLILLSADEAEPWLTETPDEEDQTDARFEIRVSSYYHETDHNYYQETTYDVHKGMTLDAGGIGGVTLTFTSVTDDHVSFESNARLAPFGGSYSDAATSFTLYRGDTLVLDDIGLCDADCTYSFTIQ